MTLPSRKKIAACRPPSPLNWMSPDLRLTSIVWMRSTTAMSLSRPANRVLPSRRSSIRARCRFWSRMRTRVTISLM